jgi:hypothetical protein
MKLDLFLCMEFQLLRVMNVNSGLFLDVTSCLESLVF